MKNFLNKVFSWSVSLFIFASGIALAEPIQLIPQNSEDPQSSSPFPAQQDVKGFWEGTPPSLVETYFSKLPIILTSPVLQELREKLLAERYTPLLKNQNYERSFLTLLMESGQFAQAQEFLLETTLSDKDKLSVDLQWLQGESKKACEKVVNLLRTSPQPEWKKQNIYCLYLNGEKERAKIAAELLTESTSDAALLLTALFSPSENPPFDVSVRESPFFLTVWCALGKEISEEDLNKLKPAALGLIARSEKMPHKTRLLAAEKAFQQGLLKGPFIADLLKEGTGEDLLDKFSDAFKFSKPKSLLPLFERAQKEGKLDIVGDVFESPLSKMDPSPETLLLAPYIVRAFLRGDHKEVAQKWGAFLMREAPEEAISVLPLLHLAFPETKWGDAQLQAWQAYQSRIDPENAPQSSYMLRRVLETLGEPQGPGMKGEPSKSSWRQEKMLFDEKAIPLLESAAESKRQGETLLLILVLFGETSLKAVPVDKFSRLLEMLKKSGYEDEARSLALEFLLVKLPFR